VLILEIVDILLQICDRELKVCVFILKFLERLIVSEFESIQFALQCILCIVQLDSELLILLGKQSDLLILVLKKCFPLRLLRSKFSLHSLDTCCIST